MLAVARNRLTEGLVDPECAILRTALPFTADTTPRNRRQGDLMYGCSIGKKKNYVALRISHREVQSRCIRRHQAFDQYQQSNVDTDPTGT